MIAQLIKPLENGKNGYMIEISRGDLNRGYFQLSYIIPLIKMHVGLPVLVIERVGHELKFDLTEKKKHLHFLSRAGVAWPRLITHVLLALPSKHKSLGAYI